jgi:hypothetical protein
VVPKDARFRGVGISHAPRRRHCKRSPQQVSPRRKRRSAEVRNSLRLFGLLAVLAGVNIYVFFFNRGTAPREVLKPSSTLKAADGANGKMATLKEATGEAQERLTGGGTPEAAVPVPAATARNANGDGKARPRPPVPIAPAAAPKPLRSSPTVASGGGTPKRITRGEPGAGRLHAPPAGRQRLQPRGKQSGKEVR